MHCSNVLMHIRPKVKCLSMQKTFVYLALLDFFNASMLCGVDYDE